MSLTYYRSLLKVKKKLYGNTLLNNSRVIHNKLFDHFTEAWLGLVFMCSLLGYHKIHQYRKALSKHEEVLEQQLFIQSFIHSSVIIACEESIISNLYFLQKNIQAQNHVLIKQHRE